MEEDKKIVETPIIKSTRRDVTNIVSEASQNESSLDRSFESCTNSYDFCVHFINKADNSVDSQFVNAEDNLTLDECLTILQDKLKRALTEVVFKKKLEADPLPIETHLSQIIQCPDDDLFVFYCTFNEMQRELSPLSKKSRKRSSMNQLLNTPTWTKKNL